MTYLIDTNVVSHAMARHKEPKVLKWYFDHEHECGLSCVTLGEIWKGIHLMPEGKRRTSLSNWAIRIERDFGEACLPLDAETLKVWGKLYAKHEAKGRNLGIVDSLIAATALVHGLVIATRNTKDFPPELKTINPWTDG